MARKNMDILVGNILGDATIQPQEKNDKTNVTSKEKQNTPQSPKNNKASPKEDQWQHFSFICSTELVVKVQAIAHKEGFTIRSFMEYVMKQGVDAYESKYGKVKKIRTKRHQGCYVKMCTCSHVYMNTLIHIHIDTCTHVA